MLNRSVKKCMPYLLSCCILITCALTAITEIYAQAVNVGSQSKIEGPILDSTHYLAGTDKDRSIQVEMNKHPGPMVIRELPAGISRLPEDVDGIKELKALPVDEADAVFVAEVTSDAAFFSSDQTSIFSTFQVKVSQVLKNRVGAAIQAGSTVEVERYGGRVKYPDGKVEAVTIYGRQYPVVGSEYVFFVKQTPNETTWTKGNAEGLDIATAYQIEGHKIDALDPTYPYRKYDGTPEDKFLSLVKAAILKHSDRSLSGGAL